MICKALCNLEKPSNGTCVKSSWSAFMRGSGCYTKLPAEIVPGGFGFGGEAWRIDVPFRRSRLLLFVSGFDRRRNANDFASHRRNSIRWLYRALDNSRARAI